ncbi:MAG TPA: DUF4175 family protein [Polyangia bacterium]|nr:DUF4175 family protein [Polyangia bacterium]
MSEREGIRSFLAAMRRRLLLRAGLETAGYAIGALAVGVFGLGLIAAAVGPAAIWPTITAGFVTVLGLAVIAAGLFHPVRALHSDRGTAQRTGALLPAMASDLLSAVELATPMASRRAGASPTLIRAFESQVAGALAPIAPGSLVSLMPAARVLGLAGLVLAALFGAAGAWPLIGRGLHTLVHRPSRFEGATASPVPIVGDVRVTYEYPPYTGLPPRTVEGSTGDIAAVKGTHVRIETHPLRPTRHALLLLGEAGDGGEIAATMAGDRLTAELNLTADGSYRFWLEPAFGRPIREERSHRLTAEVDAPPQVAIQGPADRLELASPRPIEIGYSASDDYGLGAVDLVFRIGDRPEQRVPLRDGAGARAVQGRTLWDPASAGLTGAERIAYRVEARDRDQIAGPKLGSSRTLYVVIQNPHQNLEDRLARQRDLLEKLVGDLADRLERDPAVAPAEPIAGDVSPADARLAALAVVHDAEESHLTLLGRMLDEDRREAVMGKTLRTALAGIADRLEHLLREEAQALAALRAPGRARAGGRARLEAASARQVTELESDVLRLDDLIGRQRLEDLASLGKELTDAQQRLQDLLERYKKTKDEGLRRQLAREARELRERLADLAQKIAAVQQRNDVPEEWRNMPEMKGLQEQARKLDEMIEKGDDADLEKALSQLGDDLRSMRKMLDQNLDGFSGERFPQENRVVAELMKKVGDIEGDERALQKETQGIADKQEAEVERRLKGQMDDLMKREGEKIDRLKQKLAGVPTGDPESALAEEIDRARESAKQMRRLMAERDVAEAKGEAERAESSLERAGEHLDEMAEARRQRRGGVEGERDKRADAVGEARGLAQEIADDLSKLMPKPSETLTPEQREAARAQAEKQNEIGRRTDELAQEAARRLGKMPGMEKAEQDLKGAGARMREAGDSLRRSESKPAATAERDAADRLSKLRDSMQARAMGGAEQHHDPVRIPGADESSAPRAWRQELLDAMKEKAPERYRDEVRRYYEELVK